LKEGQGPNANAGGACQLQIAITIFPINIVPDRPSTRPRQFSIIDTRALPGTWLEQQGVMNVSGILGHEFFGILRRIHYERRTNPATFPAPALSITSPSMYTADDGVTRLSRSTCRPGVRGSGEAQDELRRLLVASQPCAVPKRNGGPDMHKPALIGRGHDTSFSLPGLFKQVP